VVGVVEEEDMETKENLEVIIRKQKKSFVVFHSGDSFSREDVFDIGDDLANLEQSYLLTVRYDGLSDLEMVGVWESWKTYREAGVDYGV